MYSLSSKIILLIQLIQYLVVFSYFVIKIERFFFISFLTNLMSQGTQRYFTKITPECVPEIITLSKLVHRFVKIVFLK